MSLAALLGRGTLGRYALIGVSGITLDFLLFVVLTRVGVDPVPATVVSTLVGIVNNYVLNATVNFGTGLSVTSGWRFIAVGLLGLLIATVSLEVLIRLGLDPLAAKVISVPCVVAGQFLANKHWSFAS